MRSSFLIFRFALLVVLCWPFCLRSDLSPACVLDDAPGHAAGANKPKFQSVLKECVTRKGGQLFLAEKPFRFLSFNAPELVLREEPHWGFNQPFEQTDLLETIHLFGGRVVRPYVMSVKGEGLAGPRHIEGVRQYNEKAFQSMDFVLAECNRVGVRMIVPFLDNWHWWGGIKEFCALRGKPETAFYTDEEIKADYKHLVSFVLNRRNTITGKLYREDPAILAWETGNELRGAPVEWTLEMAEYIKGIDGKHHVVDGNDEHISSEVLDSPHIDIVVRHYYRGTEGKGGPVHYGERYLQDFRKCQGKKPLLIEEFGIAPHEEMLDLCAKIVASEGTGGLVWSLRQHESHGGFRSHFEGKSGFAAYHLPGFSSGNDYHEREWLTGYRQASLAISGLEPKPQARAPKLLPIETVMDIRWQGVPLAKGYDIQKSTEEGQWSFVGRNISDASISRMAFRSYKAPGNPSQPDMFWPILFQDLETQAGTNCSYRIRSNVDGVWSEWSEPVDAVVDRSSGPRFADNVKFNKGVYRCPADGPVNSIVFRCKCKAAEFNLKLFGGMASSTLSQIPLEIKEEADWRVFQSDSIPDGIRFLELRATGSADESFLALGVGNYRVLKSSE